MNLPLPKTMQTNALRERANRGLLWNKFFDQWAAGFNKVRQPSSMDKVAYHGGKMNWILANCYPRTRPDGTFQVSESERKVPFRTGDAAMLAMMGRRQAALISSLSGRSAAFETSGPFVSGTGLAHPVENGFLFHHSLGVPYLPGSSVKGMIRAWADHWLGAQQDYQDRILRVFGRSNDEGGVAAGSVIVFDAIPLAPVALTAEIVTPHTGDWRITATPESSPPADWISPNPIHFLAVASGTPFQFALAPRNPQGLEDLNFAWTCLQDALDWIGAGAKTASGFGRFTSRESRERRHNEMAIIAAQEAERQTEAERRWSPSVGEAVNYAGDKHWVVALLEGGQIEVRDERGKHYPIDLDEIAPWKGR